MSATQRRPASLRAFPQLVAVMRWPGCSPVSRLSRADVKRERLRSLRSGRGSGTEARLQVGSQAPSGQPSAAMLRGGVPRRSGSDGERKLAGLGGPVQIQLCRLRRLVGLTALRKPGLPWRWSRSRRQTRFGVGGGEALALQRSGSAKRVSCAGRRSASRTGQASTCTANPRLRLAAAGPPAGRAFPNPSAKRQTFLPLVAYQRARRRWKTRAGWTATATFDNRGRNVARAGSERAAEERVRQPVKAARCPAWRALARRRA
jgi:hypothetical protein